VKTKRRHTSALVSRLVVGVAISACAAMAQATGYKIVELGTLGGPDATGHAINDAGTVVGSSSAIIDSFQHDRATMWKNGSVIDLGSIEGTRSRALAVNVHDQPVGSSRIKPSIFDEMAVRWTADGPKRLKSLGGHWSAAQGINDKGVVAGWSQTSGANHAAVWHHTGVHDLGTLGGYASHAMAINRAGTVVGMSGTSKDTATEHAVRWGADRQPVDLGTLGGTNSQAFAINDVGTIVGRSDLPGDRVSHATRWDANGATDLGALGGPDRLSSAYGINKKGVVVGSSQDRFFAWHATVWTKAGMIDLNDHLDVSTKAEGWELQTAKGINASGQIVCNGRNSWTGQERAFLASPIVD
jgi:probable HAF family extracellular repeat protein